MAQYDLIIRGGSLVAGSGVSTKDIAVKDGIIADIEDNLSGSASREINAEGMAVLPGGIDCHVHLNSPGHCDWETAESGTRALAAGGMTSFFDMPLNSLPVVTDAQAFDKKLEYMQGSSLIDFALWGGLVPGKLDELYRLAEKGVVGFKAFTCFSGLDEFPGCDDYTLYRGMQIAKELGLPVAVHCENGAIINGLSERLISENRTDCEAFLLSRPPITEIEPISKVVMLAMDTGCKVHIAHVSTPEGVDIVNAARAKGYDVSCETVPQYLLFSSDELSAIGALGKCCPPLRSGESVARLWDRLARGDIDIVCSDHSPAPDSLKRGNDFFKIWGGISGCQSTLSVLLTAVSENRLSLSRASALVSENVASRFLISQKGRIERGFDADITICSLDESFVLQESELYYLHKRSPMAGMRFCGKVKHTLVRGQTVFDGSFKVLPGYGRFIRRKI